MLAVGIFIGRPLVYCYWEASMCIGELRHSELKVSTKLNEIY